VVIGASAGRPVFLRDVAAVKDGPEEPASYVRFGSGKAAEGAELALGGASAPAVTLSIAKHQGQNAVAIVADVLRKVMADFAAKNVAVTEQAIRAKMSELIAVAAAEVKAGK
jgi:hypothetical protein